MVALKVSIDSIYLKIYHRARVAAEKRQKYKGAAKDSGESEFIGD